ncbi:vWA domain-containing protein, partial [Akkermansia massiliensis]
MTFLYPNVLYALILPALLAAAAWWLWRRRSRKWEVLVSPEYRQELVHAPATWHRVLPVIFAVLASIFAILSIARPVDGYTEVKEIPKSRNILIAIDCSRSMLSKDASPTRLGRAKTAAYDLLDALPGDNFGIIIFSGDAVLLMPLTHDHNALKETIEQLQFGWVSQGGTNLENVVRLALQTFKRDKEADAKNALVILSDGEDTVNITYKTAEAARQHQLIIVTAGIGTTIGTTIPDEQSPSGLYRDRRGQHVVSKLNPESLQYLARQTDGQYVQLSDGAALNRFVRDIADRLDITEGREEVRRVPNDRYVIFAVPALICLLLTLLAGTRWRSFRRSGRRGMTALAAATLLCAGLLGTEARADTSALDNVTDLIRTGKTEEAVKAIDEMLAVPDLAEETRQALEFAKGCLEQKADNPKEAAEAFSQALLSPKASLQADSHFNLGNLEAAQARKTMIFSRPEGEQPQAQPSSIDDQIKEIDARLAKIPVAKEHVKEAVKRFDDALSAYGSHEGAAANKEEMLRYDKSLDEYRKQLEELKKKLEEEKKKQQEQQNKDQNKDQNK